MIIRNISKEAGLSRVYTPHCIRATAIQALADANVELRHIMYLSGHKNEASIRSSVYDDKKRELSTVLQQLTESKATPGTPHVPSATVSRPPITENTSPSVQIQDNTNFNLNNMASTSGGFMPRGSFNNCSFNITFTKFVHCYYKTVGERENERTIAVSSKVVIIAYTWKRVESMMTSVITDTML